MNKTRIAISGTGRIGRLCIRAPFETGRNDIEIAAINSRGSLDTLVHLLKYDSVHGRFNGTITHDDKAITINGTRIPVLQESDPEKLDWKPYNIDVLFECTGKFSDRAGAMKHIHAGAHKVLISAPGTDEDFMAVFGVNDTGLRPEHSIVSNGSCTTNALAPVAMVLNDAVGITRGFMTTIHAYTGDQNIHDGTHKDLHRARAATLSMVPTTTGAAKSIGKVIPALQGKLDGTSVRVPTANVSMIDLKFDAARATTVAELQDAFRAAASGPLRGILGVYDEPLVSIDFNHSDCSAYVGLNEIKVIDGTLCRVMAWYDNEWAFSLRMLDIAARMKMVG